VQLDRIRASDAERRLVERSPDRLVFQRGARPAWTVLAAIFLFPVGLIALLHKGSKRIAVDFVQRGDEVAVIAQGVAPLSVRRAFAALED
jgi:hypothetical protein